MVRITDLARTAKPQTPEEAASAAEMEFLDHTSELRTGEAVPGEHVLLELETTDAEADEILLRLSGGLGHVSISSALGTSVAQLRGAPQQSREGGIPGRSKKLKKGVVNTRRTPFTSSPSGAIIEGWLSEERRPVGRRKRGRVALTLSLAPSRVNRRDPRLPTYFKEHPEPRS